MPRLNPILLILLIAEIGLVGMHTWLYVESVPIPRRTEFIEVLGFDITVFHVLLFAIACGTVFTPVAVWHGVFKHHILREYSVVKEASHGLWIRWNFFAVAWMLFLGGEMFFFFTRLETLKVFYRLPGMPAEQNIYVSAFFAVLLITVNVIVAILMASHWADATEE